MVRPELSLFGRTPRSFSGRLCARMVAQWNIAIGEPDLAAKFLDQSGDRRFSASAKWASEIRKFHDRDRRVGSALVPQVIGSDVRARRGQQDLNRCLLAQLGCIHIAGLIGPRLFEKLPNLLPNLFEGNL